MKTLAPLQGFVQTDLSTHEAWKQLTLEKPMAAALMHQLVVLADKDNYVAASHNALAELMGVSKISIRRAMETLREGNWVQVLQGEQQLPSGDGLPPVSQPSLPGMLPDLPAVYEDGE